MASSDSDMEMHDDSDFSRRWNWNNRNRCQLNNSGNNVVTHNNTISPWNKEHDGVTTLYRCEASDAKALYVFDIAYKLQQSDQYDIGGAYKDNDQGLWFYFTTSCGPGRNYLMNIFVCQRKPGMFSLGISDSNTLTTTIYNNDKVRTLSSELYWQKFNSTQPDEVIFIKTFRFSEEDRLSLLKMILVVPVSINMSPKNMLIKAVVHKIKGELEFGEELLKDQAHDFFLKSSEGKEFKVHKIILAAHSPTLRDLIRADDCNTLTLDIINYDTELLLQYLYTGVIKDISKHQIDVLLLLADKFKLNNLTELAKQAMKFSIKSENVLAIAIVADKFNCEDVQEAAFKYIARHPEVLDSDAFTEMDNTNVVKKLLKYIHVKTNQK